MKNKLIQLIKGNEQGYSLLIAVFALVLLSVLGLSIFTVSGNTLKTSKNERLDQAVYYIAEAALVEKKAKLNEEFINLEEQIWDKIVATKIQGDTDEKLADLTNLYRDTLSKEFKEKYDNTSETYESFNESYDKYKPFAEVSVKKSTGDFEYIITSKGFIDDKTRIVKSTFSIDPNFEINLENKTVGEDKPEDPSDLPESIYSPNVRLITADNSPPTLKGQLENTTYAVIKDYATSTDPIISFLYNEFKYHDTNCAKPNSINSSISYQVEKAISIKNKDGDYTIDVKNINSNIHTIYINGDVYLYQDKLIINKPANTKVNLVICGDLSAHNGGGNDGSKITTNDNKKENLGIFIRGTKTDFNNVGIESNFVFAPNLEVDFKGNINLCSSMFVKKFVGKGGGKKGGFTDGCSKGIDTSTPTNPSIPPIDENNNDDTDNSNNEEYIVTREESPNIKFGNIIETTENEE